MDTSTLVEGLAEATAVRSHEGGLRAEVVPGWDVFGIPHGGYLMGIAARGALVATELPDVMSITTHFTRKASFGPMDIEVVEVGGSRRFTTVAVHGRQGEELVTTSLVLLADRDSFDGPRWTNRNGRAASEDQLTPAAGSPGFEATPAVAHRLGLRLLREDAGFWEGRATGEGLIRGLVDPPSGEVADQVLAIVAADVTPPALWNALGPTGWVPTVELSAQLRARPAPGPLWVVARTTDVGDGFTDEEAEVHDSTGRLILHSNQHARYSQPGG